MIFADWTEAEGLLAEIDENLIRSSINVAAYYVAQDPADEKSWTRPRKTARTMGASNPETYANQAIAA